MIDTVLFAILCAAAVGLASLSGECHEIPEQKLQQDLSYVQFQCEDAQPFQTFCCSFIAHSVT